jgi:thiamine-monophosphate kinase
MNAKQLKSRFLLQFQIVIRSLRWIVWRITRASREYNVDIIGGDTTSPKGLIISITAIGEADEDEIVYRNGQKRGC